MCHKDEMKNQGMNAASRNQGSCGQSKAQSMNSQPGNMNSQSSAQGMNASNAQSHHGKRACSPDQQNYDTAVMDNEGPGNICDNSTPYGDGMTVSSENPDQKMQFERDGNKSGMSMSGKQDQSKKF